MTYKQFYLTTTAGEKELVEKLKSDPQQVIDCKKRLSELEGLLRLDDGRCHVSKVQRDFLKRILVPYVGN